MSFNMFLEILRALERLSAEFASMRLEGDVDANVGGDMVAFDDGDMAVPPCALEIEVVCAFSSYMTVAHMLLNHPLIKVQR